MASYQLDGYPDNLYAQQVTIPAGGSLSDVVATNGKALVGIKMPAAWTAANLAFLVATQGVGTPITCVFVRDSNGVILQSVVDVNYHVALPSNQALFWPWLQVQSVNVDGAGAAVTQVAAATIVLIFRKFLS